MIPTYKITGQAPCFQLELNGQMYEFQSCAEMLARSAQKHHAEYKRQMTDHWERLHTDFRITDESLPGSSFRLLRQNAEVPA